MIGKVRKQTNFRRVMFKTGMLVLALFSISSCSTYPNKFKCGDARGLGCTMLHEVDKQIDSGQIAEAYKDKNCRGKQCPANPIEEGLILKKRDNAKSYADDVDEDPADDNSLNF